MIRKITTELRAGAIGKLRICGLLLVAIWTIPACEPTDDAFDIEKVTGAWACEETSNSTGAELLDYRITITSTGTNTCTISHFMGLDVTVPATVSDSWSITVPDYTKGSYTYWGNGKVNISKMTITLDMWSKAGSASENIQAECKRP
jgi:hypothetical protein